MAVREYLKACTDIFQSGLVKGDIVRQHIEQQILIDKFLPDSASFFFVVEPVNHKYHFMGKQQESVSGYTNDEVMSRGMEFLFACLHPDEVGILQEEIYPQIASTLRELSQKEDIKKPLHNLITDLKPKAVCIIIFWSTCMSLKPTKRANRHCFLVISSFLEMT